MAELSLNQIIDKLNSELCGENRKIVFWYDDNGEFAEDIESIELAHAKILYLEKDNQFYIKYFLERVDTTTHYLVYAPFPKPDIRDNHLEDTVRYSKRFFADRATLITLDLGYDESLKSVFQEYSKFFVSKERRQKFYDLEIEAKTKADIEVGIMSIICKLRTSDFDEVIKTVLLDDDFEENKYFEEFSKYGVDKAFWEQADIRFGYSDTKPTLEKFILTMFVTYLSKTIYGDIPQSLKQYIAYKSTNNIRVYLDNLMNSTLYGESFDRISDYVYDTLDLGKHLRKMQTEDVSECGLFADIDNIIIDWLIERLENEDVTAKLNGKSIMEICENRRRQHFGMKVQYQYFAIEYAWKILSFGKYEPVSGIGSLIKKYTETLFDIDRSYRYFYDYFDKAENDSRFESLRQLVENVYTNEYLNPVCVNWNKEFFTADGNIRITKQINFFDKYIRQIKERTVVIISDALRYETGCSLFEKFRSDEKCKVKIEPMLSVLPSYTRLGMAALLPHQTIEMTDDFEVLVDGKTCNDTVHREQILKSYKPNSRCVQYDDLKNMSVAQLREVFTNKEVVYVYHNQIDARGDKPNTENEVFTACEEAINEIFALVKRLTTSANTIHFIITADHGFIYKRDSITESDKIGSISESGTYKAKRYVISSKAIETDGVESISFSSVLQNDDDKIISFPIASDIFKAPGGGMNFVHGGSSPQEMLVPVIDVRTEKGHKETKNAVISLISLNRKITNLIFSLEFIQNEPVGSIVKETTYRICIVSANGEKVSNEMIHIADNKNSESAKRIFKLNFRLKNRPYRRSEKYYLLIIDNKNNLEVLRQEMMIDIAFADDFGF